MFEQTAIVRVDLFTCQQSTSLITGQPNTNFFPGREKIAIFTVSAGKLDNDSVKMIIVLEVYGNF